MSVFRRRALALGLVVLVSAGASGCTLYMSDHALNSAYPPYPPYATRSPPGPGGSGPGSGYGGSDRFPPGDGGAYDGRYGGRDYGCRATRAPSQGWGDRGGYVHIVRRGDTLYSISRLYYGADRYWSAIYNRNRDVLASPNCLYPGQRLVIPG